ncbi:MAG: hypothetical protein PHS82_14510 [Lachnospiraceae bacterium]|nr:hypothetical protein [Lachnospiraceae bacterium]
MFFENPIPFHMAYPSSSFYDNEQEAQTDLNLMKSYYPELAVRIQEKVGAECDCMEYDGSMIYDAYPDNHMVERTCGRITRDLCSGCEDYQESQIEALVRVMFCHEMFQRRCRHRRIQHNF